MSMYQLVAFSLHQAPMDASHNGEHADLARHLVLMVRAISGDVLMASTRRRA